MYALFQIRSRLIIVSFFVDKFFSLGIRLMRLTIPRSANSFKGEAFSFLSVFPARHCFGILVSSVSLYMCVHSPTKKNYHVLAF